MRRKIAALLCAMLMLVGCAAFAQDDFARTPAFVRERFNGIFPPAEDFPAPFVDRIEFDDAGGFIFCAADGEHVLKTGSASAVVYGRIDGQGRVEQLSLSVKPSQRFERAYAQQADSLLRAGMLSMFGELADEELQLLMDSYLFDVRPYRYCEDDRAVGERMRMCEMELRGEILRIEGEAGADNVLHLRMNVLYDADEATAMRARDNVWRIRRLARAASECEMIGTCGEYLDDTLTGDYDGQTEEISALLDLIGHSAQAIAGLQTEQMHAQEAFLIELQGHCAQLGLWINQYETAIRNQNREDAWARLQDICRISEEIARLPESLY